MNAFARAQLTFQMLTLIKKYPQQATYVLNQTCDPLSTNKKINDVNQHNSRETISS